jgi:tripartite-type tricarboxylate transporter receptor subunit TctC
LKLTQIYALKLHKFLKGKETPMKLKFLTAAFSLALAGAGFAQDFPNKPITLIIPFAAGGPTDVVARLISEPFSKALGQPVIIENVVGAGGTTGSSRMQTAAPDGHTIGIGHTGTHAAAVALYPALKYNPVTDFAHIGVVNTNAIYVVAKKDVPATNLKDFVAWLKANEAKVNQAHAGIGSVSHTTGLLFNSVVGVKTQSVPYRGTGPAMNDLVGGQVDYMTDQVVNVAPQVKAGTIKSFAVAQEKRTNILPEIPTAAEAGYPTFQVVVWNAMVAPKGIPDAVAKKLNAALNAALNDPATRAKLLELGAEIPEAKLLTSAGQAEFIQKEMDKWVPIIKAAGVTAQ